MDKVYEQAFSEIDEIFKIMPIDLLIKIPVQFRRIISENKDKNYKIKIQEPLSENRLKKETIVILGLIYRDFLASPEEREEIKQRDFEEIKKAEKEMQQQYDMENVFKNRKIKMEENAQSTELILYEKQGFLGRIFDLIKGLFKKK